MPTCNFAGPKSLIQLLTKIVIIYLKREILIEQKQIVENGKKLANIDGGLKCPSCMSSPLLRLKSSQPITECLLCVLLHYAPS